MILPIIAYGDPVLRKTGKEITKDYPNLDVLLENMFETMYDAPGIGLAATQVNFHKRIIVIDISDECNQPLCLINPKIIEKNGEIEWEEGCLSVPNYYESVKRSNEIKVSALNQLGELCEIDASEMLAVCIQHEMDHLNGILFVDHLSKLKQKRLKKKAEKNTLKF